ncbi:hypothetical protein [Halalkalicoccus ordinarius]|uniref:hypothetical protein n=1 Tax=Halalkalicoccus ordinarius TaxID=3116651 RepID=UPI00300F578F
MSSIARRAAAAVLGVALLSMPASAHGRTAAAVGLSFPLVVAGIVLVSPFGGGFVLVAYGRLPWSTRRAVLPALVFVRHVDEHVADTHMREITGASHLGPVLKSKAVADEPLRFLEKAR